jgi:hypothetical protein
MSNEDIEGIEINDADGNLVNTVNVRGDAATLLNRVATRPTEVSLTRPEQAPTDDQALWVAIRNRAEAIGFNRYNEFINRLLCEDTDYGSATCGANSTTENLNPKDFGEPSIDDLRTELNTRPNIYGVDAYNLLKLATQAFLIFESGIVIQHSRNPITGVPDITRPVLGLDEERLGEPVTLAEITARLAAYLGLGDGKLPYLTRILNALVGLNPERRAERLPYCEAILRNRLSCPSLLELIWSYWHEEGMLIQTMNAISMRFQNRRGSYDRDPLANLEIDPLRPLNNLFWGYIQDEYNRLTVMRRAYEYDHHYGLTLYGKAVPELRSADSRSKFLEGFHNLLYRAAVFYREDADTTVISDGFPLLNALREVHLLLAEGAHNQFGDLPWTARGEMLMMEWLLSRQEMREFLRGRAMVPYQEPWMGQVDTMKKLQGWTDTTITHFRNLAVDGEQILLSIRYGDWIDVNVQDQAKNWARFWRPEIQRYIHAYLSATGVDLSEDIVGTWAASDRYLQPSVHLRNRLAAQRQGLPGAIKALEPGDQTLALPPATDRAALQRRNQ